MNPLLEEKTGEINLLKYAVIIYRHKLLIGGVTLAAAVLGVIIALILPRQYKADLTLVPNLQEGTSPGLSVFSGVASSFGLGKTLTTSESERYQDFIRSRNFAERLASIPFHLKGSEPRLLHQWLELEFFNEDSAKHLLIESVQGYLERALTVDIRDNGIIYMELLAPHPELASQCLNRIADLFDKHYREYQTQKAQDMRSFLESQTEELLKQLRQAEDSLRLFREQNVSFEASPQLALEYGRLQRQVQMQMDLYGTVKKELEMAKIQEYREIPILKVLDPALTPEFPSKPRRKLIVLGFLIGGFFLSVGFVLIRRYFRKTWPQVREAVREEGAA